MPHRTLAAPPMNPPQVRHPASTRALLAGLALSLGGCAMAPGMYVGKQGALEAPKRTTLFSAMNRPVELITVAGPTDAAPPGAITRITPALIQQQRAARRDEVPAEVQALFAAPKT